MDLSDFQTDGGKSEVLQIMGKYNIENTPTNWKVFKRAMEHWNKANQTLYCVYNNTAANNLLFSSNSGDTDVSSYFVCKYVGYTYRFEDVNVFWTLTVRYISPYS